MSSTHDVKIPAPERDLRNTEPSVPPASTQTSPITRAIFGSIAIAFGIAIVVISLVAAIFHVSPLPRSIINSDEVTAAIFAGLSGLCLIGCGTFIFKRSLLITALLLLLSIVCGFTASAIA